MRNPIDPNNLNPRQQALIDCMAQFPYPPLHEAARICNLNPQTCRVWHMDPNFKMVLAEARSKEREFMQAEYRHRILGLLDKALEVKDRSMDSKRDDVAEKASTWILEKALDMGGKLVISGPDGGPIATAHSVEVSELNEDELRALLTGPSSSGDGEA